MYDEDDLDWKGTLLDPNTRRRAPSSQPAAEPKGKMVVIAAAIGAVLIGAGVIFALSSGSDENGTPLIKADTTPYKSRPETPGGADIPFQDKLVFNRLDPNGQPVQAEKLLPGAEEPLAHAAKPSEAPKAEAVPMTKEVTAAPQAAEAPAPQAAPATPVAAEPVKPTVVESPKAVETPAQSPVQTPAQTVAKVEAKPAPVTAPTPAPVAKTAPVATAAPTPAGSVRVQLASIPNQENAQKALGNLSSQYKSALGSATLTVVKADLGAKGIYYRVQSTPVDKSTADRICSGVKAQGGACIIAK